MTTTTEMLTKTRKSYLSSLKDPQAPSQLLLDLLVQAKKQTPELLSELQPGTGKNALSSNPIDWSAEYFSRHLLLAEQNFARERIEHLIAVREHLRGSGVKGFVPVPVVASNNKPAGGRSETSGYSPSSMLKKFVAEGDLLTIRTTLRMELNDNSLNSDDLRAALAWANTQLAGLLEAYSEKSFARGMDADRKHWDSQYFENQVVYLKANFCEERFLHLIEVREVLRQQNTEGFAAAPPKARSRAGQSAPAPAQRQQEQSQRSGSAQSAPEFNPIFKTALMVGGAIAALVVFLVALVK
jgi:hypothetical protein